MTPRLIAVVGPTATGKSALGIALAERFGGEIVSCDSTAVYRGFDIGTDKVPLAERRGIPHHMMDVVDPTKEYSAARYAREAAAIIRAITARGRLPIVVGGTGFYYRALTRGLFEGPSRDEALRHRLERVAARRGHDRLHRWLARVDPASAARIAPPDVKRVVRALEVWILTGRPLTEHFAATASPLPEYGVTAFALQISPAETADRVARRVEKQFASGLLDEIRGLLARGVPETALPFTGLVYRQALEHLRGIRDEAETRDLIVRENRKYSRRQLIWFRKEPNLRWIHAAGERAETLETCGSVLQGLAVGTPQLQSSSTGDLQNSGTAEPRNSRTSEFRNPSRMLPSRVFLTVLDSVGIGELPDADAYGDRGSDTLGNISRRVPLKLPALRSLGIANVANVAGVTPVAIPLGAYGRMAERSAGKDSVTGHWELAGIVLERPFPTFPDGFPRDVIEEFERRIGRRTIGNYAASGTAIIDELGPEHIRTGSPIVYTSADSVFQIAAHEEVIPIAELYRICEIAYELVGKGMNVGRIIARPFVGTPGAFTRTANRHDYALAPTGTTLLDALTVAGHSVHAIGKVKDLFAGRGVTTSVHTKTDDEGVDAIEAAIDTAGPGLVFTNLVDFDTQYGHRNDAAGYAANLERFDGRLSRLLPRLRTGDLLVITADHGNDPTTPSTDHAREYVPVFLVGASIKPGTSIGVRSTFADLGQTVAEIFGVGPLANGTSFLRDILRE